MSAHPETPPDRPGAAEPDNDVPERPALAPATWLVGQLQESALQDPPWAVERSKVGYILMGELAFRIAEQADGSQTVEQIAVAASAALGRQVRPSDVQAMIHTVLIPRGVVADADGYVHDDTLEGPGEPEPEAPSLGQGQRAHVGRMAWEHRAAHERVIGPGPLDAVASVLMWLFWPPIALVVLGVSLAMLIWLFVLHGLAAGFVQVLLAPLLIPFVLILTLLGAVVQGIGPMVTLYSGGATIERLRYTPSLPFPSFAVDMADDYGLSRWSRFMVNVSGVYLQLVAAGLLCILGMLLGADFLYVPVVLLVLNVLRLLVPFGRPGADRLLAELLLVKEPLRYAEQRISNWLPGSPPPADLPPLKRWGHATIWIYLGVVTLKLAFVALAILWATPTILTTTVEALLAHLSGMSEAVGERNVLGFLESAISASVLAVSCFAVVVLLILGLRALVIHTRRWCVAAPGRRRVVATVAPVVAVLLVLFWLPVSGFAAGNRGALRSVVGAAWAPLTGSSRGTVLDLFNGPAPFPLVAEPNRRNGPGEQPVQPTGSPVVNQDVGSGGVSGPVPDAQPANPGAGSSAGAPDAGAASATGTPGARPGAGQLGAPGAAPGERETPAPAQKPEVQGTSGAGGQDPGQTGAPGAATADTSTAPSLRPTNAASKPDTSDPGAPATPASAGPPGSQNAAPAVPAKPTVPVVNQPIDKPAGEPKPAPAAAPNSQPQNAAPAGSPVSR